ncbi:MAG: RNA recognition motif domain-containing protein [Prochlorococcaceae cyanobacterium]
MQLIQRPLSRQVSFQGELQGFLHSASIFLQGIQRIAFISFIDFMTIYVGNLSFDAEVADLQQLFAEYGTVRKCSLPLDRETGRKRGFAFVEMEQAGDETKAIDDLQNVEWMGRMIRVNKAEPRPAPSGGGNRW